MSPVVSVPFTGSLSALVYQHSITPISLPCALKIPEKGKTFLNKIKLVCSFVSDHLEELFSGYVFAC